MNECVLVRKREIGETLASEPFQGKRLLEPLKSLAIQKKLPFNILEEKEIANDAEVHKDMGDLWHCLEGEVVFVYGGELVSPVFQKNADGSFNDRELRAREIKNGKEAVMQPGDWLWIPPGEPHQHRTSQATRLLIVKIPAFVKQKL